MSPRKSASGTTATPPGGPGSGRSSRVSVLFLDGREISGTVSGFNPRQVSFYLAVTDERGSRSSQAVDFHAVKAVQFLKDDPAGASATFPQSASLVTLRFIDGEVLKGVAQSYGGARHGLYLVPTELPDVERIYVPITAIRETVSVKRLGDIMTERGMVTVGAVQKALARQQELRNEPIGQILLKNRAIDDHQLESGLERQRQEGRRLGEILLELGYINGDQLAEALRAQQEQRSKKFGQVLLELGFATHKMIAQAIAIQYNLPFLELTRVSVDPSLLRIVPEDLVKRLQLLPVSLQDEVLTIAVSDPTNHTAKEELRKKTSFAVAEAVATQHDIRLAIDRHYQGPNS